MTITQFIINNTEKRLTINFAKSKSAHLSFEYLRVSSPVPQTVKGKKTPVAHKKSVVLTGIENVGKHGFRLLFDDQHSAIFPIEYLTLLCQEYEQRWQSYLTELKASGHSREVMINITQL